MPNLMATPTNFPRRINSYVPAMAYSADVNYNGETRVNFGAPIAGGGNDVSGAGGINIGTAGQTDLSNAAIVGAPFGRNVTMVAIGASTAVLTLYGWDYLGQPIAEAITLNGTTPVVGNKAFKAFNYLVSPGSPTSIFASTGAKLGLPYKAVRAVYEIGNGALAAAGTLQAPSLVDPATTTTTDPRGMYTPTTALNGVNIISAAFNMANDVNTSNHGGLHGIQQAAA